MKTNAMIPAADVLTRVPTLADLSLGSVEGVEHAFAQTVLGENLLGESGDLGEAVLNFLRDEIWRVPTTGDHPLARALHFVRQRLRGSREVEIWISRSPAFSLRTPAGVCVGETLHLFFEQRLVAAVPNERALAFHLGAAIWEALEPRSGLVLARRNAALRGCERVEAVRVENFRAYQAAAYGLLACGDETTAIAESFRRYSPIGATLDASLLLAISEGAVEHGVEDAWKRRFMDLNNPDYPAGLPLGLRLFATTELHRSLCGESGGLEWTEFERRLLDIEERVNGDPESFWEEVGPIVSIGVLLGTAFLLETTPAFDAEKVIALLDASGIANRPVAEILPEWDWTIGPDGNTAEMITNLLAEQGERYALILNSARGDLLHGPICGFYNYLCGNASQGEDNSPWHTRARQRFLELADLLHIDAKAALGYWDAVTEQLMRDIHDSPEDA
ncbi:MAG: hypothetical protein JJT96_18790 [Opitutales bacterium]|nr:hypothetical protein [Opitutales bacterium]